jgi:hypothetical protein
LADPGLASSPESGWPVLGSVALAGLALSADWVYYLFGLRRVREPGRYARALAQAPFYLAMWLWSLTLSVISTHPWLSVRRER